MSEDRSTKNVLCKDLSVISLAKPLIMNELSKIISRQPRRATIIQAPGGHYNNKKGLPGIFEQRGQAEGPISKI